MWTDEELAEAEELAKMEMEMEVDEGGDDDAYYANRLAFENRWI